MTCRRAPHDVGRAQRTTPPAYRARTSTAITARSALLCCHRRDGETDEAVDTRVRTVLTVRTVLIVPVLGSTLRRADAFARTELGRPPDTRPTLPQIIEMRQLLGFVGQQTVGWYDEVNLICVCGADEDAEHATDCPLADDLLRE